MKIIIYNESVFAIMSASTNNIMNTTRYNPTAAQISGFTATVSKSGKKWVHQLLDERGIVIATRKTDAEFPYTSAAVLVTTKQSRIAWLKREAAKSRSKSFIESCRADIKIAEKEISEGADASQYHGFDVSWTRGSGSGCLMKFIARLVPCK
jgi:hypothetical protein